MAPLKFRTEPLSFPLTRDLKTHVTKTVTKDSIVVLFGYCVLFTLTKKREYLNSQHRLAKFDTFHSRVDSWLATFSAAELTHALHKEDRVADFGFNYSKQGVYNEEGIFVKTLDAYARDNGLQVATLPAKRFTRSFVKTHTSEAESGQASSVDNTRHTDAAVAQEKRYATETARKSQDHDEAMRRSRRAFDEAHKGAVGGSGTTSTTDKGKRSTSFDSADKTGMTHTQGKKIAHDAKDIEPKKVTYVSYASFNLGDKQRPLGFSEVHVPVSRGDYSAVTSTIIRGKQKGFVITGPTGCGKSTVALLPLFISGRRRVMVVEPTQANAANIYHEFANILPNLFVTGVIPWSVPKVQFVAPTIMRPPFTPLQVTTTDKLLEYFEYYGKLPDVDCLVIDEFHLPIPSMVQTVELLRTFDFGMKYIFVSATAEGYAVNPQLPKAVTQIYGQLPLGQIPTKLEGSDLDPRRWFSRGDGTVGVVAPSVVVATRLFHVYKQWKLRTFLITRETRVTEYMKAATNHRPRTVYVLEPGVEAGVTLSLAVLISMGSATAIRYDGKVVVEDTQSLDPIAAIQRGGRGGRVVPTLYVTPRAPDGSATVSSAGYYRAQAMVKLIAAGASVSKVNDRGLFESFPRLTTVSRELAVAAVAAGGDPFVALYQRADDGRVYKECGGTGRGFHKLAAKELFLYHYTGGFFVAPIADFSDLESRPDTFVERQSQLSAAHQIAASVEGLEDSYTLDDLVALLISKFDVYVKDLFDRLRAVFSESKPTLFSVKSRERSPDVGDFLSEAPEIAKLFEYMVSQPSGVVYERKESSSQGFRQSSHSFIYGDKYLHFAFAPKFMNGHSLNVSLLCSEVFELLRGLLAIEMLIDGAPEKCVNLEDYIGRVPREHVWFNTNVGRHGRVLN